MVSFTQDPLWPVVLVLVFVFYLRGQENITEKEFYNWEL